MLLSQKLVNEEVVNEHTNQKFYNCCLYPSICRSWPPRDVLYQPSQFCRFPPKKCCLWVLA